MSWTLPAASTSVASQLTKNEGQNKRVVYQIILSIGWVCEILKRDLRVFETTKLIWHIVRLIPKRNDGNKLRRIMSVFSVNEPQMQTRKSLDPSFSIEYTKSIDLVVELCLDI